MDQLFKREPENPLITQKDLPVSASAVYNPGATVHDGDVVLLIRIEDRKGFSSIHVARSGNGVTDWEIRPEPILRYGEPEMRYERLGCEDARVTYIEEDDEYYITYVAYSGNGPAVALARTEDFEEAERVGLILSPSNKDAVMFPRKINGHYIVLHRPEAGQIEHIWSAQSPDLIHWGMPHCVLPERGGPWWDGVKVGAGPPPVLTDDGWLLIYHGVKMFGGSMVYRVGMALLDREEPHHALARTPGWVFAPEAEYEVRGVLANVVFPCGAFKRGDELWMYYGAADTSICLARASLADIPLAMRTGE